MIIYKNVIDSSCWTLIKTADILKRRVRKQSFCIKMTVMQSPFVMFRIGSTYGNNVARVGAVAIKSKCVEYKALLL